MNVTSDFFNLDINPSTAGIPVNSNAAMRTFYAKAPERDWALQRKVWTVIGSAVVSWGAIFGCAALVIGH